MLEVFLLSICTEFTPLKPVMLFVPWDELYIGDILNNDVLVSFILTPAVTNPSIILFIAAEFIVAASFAVLPTVCTPKVSITSSGATWVVEDPILARA